MINLVTTQQNKRRSANTSTEKKQQQQQQRMTKRVPIEFDRQCVVGVGFVLARTFGLNRHSRRHWRRIERKLCTANERTYAREERAMSVT
jgi:hypothetical protein